MEMTVKYLNQILKCKKSVSLQGIHDSSKAKRINNFKNERRRSVTRKVSKFATDRNKNASEIQSPPK